MPPIHSAHQPLTSPNLNKTMRTLCKTKKLNPPLMPPTANHTVHGPSAQNGKYKRIGSQNESWTRWERDPGSACLSVCLAVWLSGWLAVCLSICFATSLTFSAPVSAFFYLFSRPLFYSSLLCFSSFQIVGSLTPKFPLKYIHFIVSRIVIDDDQRPCGQVFSTLSPYKTVRARRV